MSLLGYKPDDDPKQDDPQEEAFRDLLDKDDRAERRRRHLEAFRRRAFKRAEHHRPDLKRRQPNPNPRDWRDELE